MGVKQIIVPWVTQQITSERRLQKRRLKTEQLRLKRNDPHRVVFYHRVNDPYSHLLLKSLPDFKERFGIELEVVLVVLEMNEAFYPAPDMLEQYALKDIQHLADLYDISFPDLLHPPSQKMANLASRIVLSHPDDRHLLRFMTEVGDAFWQNDESALQALSGSMRLISDQEAAKQWQQNQQKLENSGHYLSGMLHYGGEWYWGLDRLGHLEKRFLDLGLAKHDPTPRYNRQQERFLAKPVTRKAPSRINLDFFFSFRSPYSYIAIERAGELAEKFGITLTIKPVLPMVMRGMKVPSAKRMYIVHDTKREAVQAGVPFGRIFDPVGPGTERAFSLFRHAASKQKEKDYILSVARGAWAEGIDLATDKGLRFCVERIGFDWQQCQPLLADDSWRETAEANRQEMFALGSWGVPTFRLDDIVVWGQDRFWVLEKALRKIAGE